MPLPNQGEMKTIFPSFKIKSYRNIFKWYLNFYRSHPGLESKLTHEYGPAL